MSEETKDIEETKVAEEKRWKQSRPYFLSRQRKKAAETVTLRFNNRWRYRSRKKKLSRNRREVLSDQGKSGSVQRRTDSFQD